MKTHGTIRAKRPKGPVRGAKEALEAFQRMNTYRDAEARADADARRYTPGVHSFYIHLDRAGLYGGVADEWEAVLGDWLRTEVERQS